MPAGGLPKILNVTGHFFGRQDGMHQFQKSHPVAYPVLMLLTKYDTSMQEALGDQINDISVMCAKDSSHGRGSL
jgi:hypothetical protein